MIIARLRSIARDARRLGAKDASAGAAEGHSITGIMCPLKDYEYKEDSMARRGAVAVNLACQAYLFGYEDMRTSLTQASG